MLETLRIRLHYLASRREDRLLFDHQTALAQLLGFADRAAKRASERLMQRYYLTAKSVSQLNTILLQNLELRISPPGKRQSKPLNERFVILGELLSAPDPSIFASDPCAIFEAFVLMQQHARNQGHRRCHPARTVARTTANQSRNAPGPAHARTVHGHPAEPHRGDP